MDFRVKLKSILIITLIIFQYHFNYKTDYINCSKLPHSRLYQCRNASDEENTLLAWFILILKCVLNYVYKMFLHGNWIVILKRTERYIANKLQAVAIIIWLQ
ncbi:hypothetical protein PUN28_001978 [Cardiocondyla obscurior]|uniref:Uncharacterized protein n=1 Tax=Cardiocondyla obscurior TaxID=286306 RepID=A0AAW2GRZ4_9HYME